MLNNRWRSQRYLAFVRSLPCSRCGDQPSQAHHLKGTGNMSGAGLKAPDWASMPLCPRCHEEMHRSPDLWARQWEAISRTVGRAIETGVLKC